MPLRGAVGAAFYIDAVQTEVVDALVFLLRTANGLISLAPIYAALEALGGTMEREYVRFGEWPLQILSDATPLVGEAIREALGIEFEGVPTRVFRPEHMCCIALQTGRAKDLLRVSMFLEQQQVNVDVLREHAQRLGLSARLTKVEGLLDESR